MSHFYDKNTGELIDGNLRDARKVNALPSPTTVLNVLGSPALKYYFRKQMFESTATTTRLPNESDDDYFDRCCKYADEHGQAARDLGGDFHSLCQSFHERATKVPPEKLAVEASTLVHPGDPMLPQFHAYVGWYQKNVVRSLMVEKSVIGQGYAGRVDHVAQLIDGRIACMDVKTQDVTKKKGKFTYYSNWSVQLGAYAGAIQPMPEVLISIALSSKGPAVLGCYEWPKPPEYYHDLFLGLLKYWKEDTDYFPV